MLFRMSLAPYWYTLTDRDCWESIFSCLKQSIRARRIDILSLFRSRRAEASTQHELVLVCVRAWCVAIGYARSPTGGADCMPNSYHWLRVATINVAEYLGRNFNFGFSYSVIFLIVFFFYFGERFLFCIKKANIKIWNASVILEFENSQ